MLFRYTENSPENAIFAPAALRVSAMAFSYTENSSFPYSVFPDCVLGFLNQHVKRKEDLYG